MYKHKKPAKTKLLFNNSTIGETIEQKVRRIMNNKESIKDGAPIIHTERKDGVIPAYDIRTDRFEIAAEIMDKASKSKVAKRQQTIAEKAKENMEKEAKTETKNETGGQSIQATSGNTGK